MGVTLLAAIPFPALALRRLQDANLSGWLLLILIGIWVLAKVSMPPIVGDSFGILLTAI